MQLRRRPYCRDIQPGTLRSSAFAGLLSSPLRCLDSERHLDHQSAAHKLQQPDGGTGAAFQQLPTPFGATGLPQLLDMSPTISRASQQGVLTGKYVGTCRGM